MVRGGQGFFAQAILSAGADGPSPKKQKTHAKKKTNDKRGTAEFAGGLCCARPQHATPLWNHPSGVVPSPSLSITSRFVVGAHPVPGEPWGALYSVPLAAPSMLPLVVPTPKRHDQKCPSKPPHAHVSPRAPLLASTSPIPDPSTLAHATALWLHVCCVRVVALPCPTMVCSCVWQGGRSAACRCLFPLRSFFHGHGWPGVGWTGCHSPQ